MNYVINASIYKTIDVNYMQKDKDGKDLEPKFEKVLSVRNSFNILVPGKDATNTAAELKAKIKTELELPDNITDIKLAAKNAALVDANAVTAYGVTYEATIPYVAPKTTK